ncbi:MAG TPA: hypothetical protein VF824_15505 [Thermoanaerobaculia bacterium]|jgi:hypothetical protein
MGRQRIAQAFVWLFVVSASLVAGASVFEHIVLTPLWAGSPPESVTQWRYGGVQGRFFAAVTPFYGLFSLGLLLVVKWTLRRQRRWAAIAAVSGVIVVVWTIAFFLPILAKTQVRAGAGLTPDEITMLVARFRLWHWFRAALLLGGWLAGLRALSLSPASDPA